MIDEAAENFLGADLAGGVESDAIIFLGGERLQAIHVVGHGHGAAAVAGIEMQEIVPRGAGFGAPRQEGVVGVQDDLVGGGAEILQDFSFGGGGIFDQRKDAVGVGGKDGVVEA